MNDPYVQIKNPGGSPIKWLMLLSGFMVVCLVQVSCGNQGGMKAGTSETASTGTLRLYPGNGRYMEYQGKPVIPITSAEHYGAVVNLDFDYKTYLETLEKEGFNYTRIFTGTYIEPVENIFGIRKNTLAPLEGRFIAPWNSENGKYDLSSFNPEYFTRLTDFVEEAARRNIIVEVTLFTSIYAENAWVLSPFNSKNNSNNVGDVDFRMVNTLNNGGLRHYQELFVRKMVQALNGFDNLFFEIQNEPWSDNPSLAANLESLDEGSPGSGWQSRVEVASEVAMEWQAWIAAVIADEESKGTKKHLIAQNISNFLYNQKVLPEGVSVINFHYALPEATILNQGIGGVTGLDETGFMPHEDQLYINQAWRFILSGGGLYNNLDYSFTAGNETGQWPIPETNPGWGGPGFRKKLSYLVETMSQVPFYEMNYSGSILANDEKMKQYGLLKPGAYYLVFLENYLQAQLIPMVPAGTYRITWMDVDTGETISEEIELDGTNLITPPLKRDQMTLLIQLID